MTARWGEPVRRAAAPVVVAAPTVSTDDVTRLLERREARPVDAVVEASSESPVATLLARREARSAVPAEPQDEGVDEAGVSPVEALLSRRAESHHQPIDDDPADAMSLARLIAAREARAAASAFVPLDDEPAPEPDAASPSLDVLLSRRDNRTRPPASPEETP